MKMEIDFHTFLQALRHQWKRILLTLAVFLAIGVVAAFLFSGRGAGDTSGSADALKPVDFSQLAECRTYYQDALALLQERYEDAAAYGAALLADASLQPEQRDTLEQQLHALERFKKSTLALIEQSNSDNNAIHVPETLLKQEIEYWEIRLSKAQFNLISSEHAAELLCSMDAPRAANDAAQELYKELLARALQAGTFSQDIVFCQSILDYLTEHPNEVLEEIRAFAQAEDAAAAEFNQLQAELVSCADTICRENALQLELLPKEGGQLSPEIRHGNAATTKTEAAAAIVLFAALAGLCIGLFWAICREAASRKRAPAVVPAEIPPQQAQ